MVSHWLYAVQVIKIPMRMRNEDKRLKYKYIDTPIYYDGGCRDLIYYHISREPNEHSTLPKFDRSIFWTDLDLPLKYPSMRRPRMFPRVALNFKIRSALSCFYLDTLPYDLKYSKACTDAVRFPALLEGPCPTPIFIPWTVVQMLNSDDAPIQRRYLQTAVT